MSTQTFLWQLATNKYIQPVEAYSGKILLIETSEEMPPALEVYRMLMCMGERGMLEQFTAIVVARPKAWSFQQPLAPSEKENFLREQADAIKRALREYNSEAMVVFNVDFGHTDPQVILPSGGHIRIDGIQKRMFVTY